MKVTVTHPALMKVPLFATVHMFCSSQDGPRSPGGVLGYKCDGGGGGGSDRA